MNTRFAPYTESKKRVMTFLLKIGGVTYDSIGKGFKYALIIASGIGLYALNKNLPPKLWFVAYLQKIYWFMKFQAKLLKFKLF